MPENYDLIVIGSGSGGYVAAIEAAKLQKKTAVIENSLLGGTCLNRGCIPTKTLMHTAGLMHELRGAKEAGLHCDDLVIDYSAMNERKAAVVSQLRDGIAFLFHKHKIDFIKGHGTIANDHVVSVSGVDGNKTFTARNILIATGAKPFIPPIPGINCAGIMTSDDLLLKSEGPCDRIVVIGGGVIGMEFAFLYDALGSRVTVIEAQDRILSVLDREISQNLKMISKKRGIDIITGAHVTQFEVSPSGKPISRYALNEKENSIEADAVLVSVGRRPVTDGLFANGYDPVILMNGHIQVDKNFQTATPGIWAVGDVTGGVQLAHAAAAQAKRAVFAMFGAPFALRDDIIPVCVYTDPEIACVGLNADDAKAMALSIKTRKVTMNSNGKSLLSMQERSFIKTVEEAETGRLLGAQLMCARATDMVGEFALAIANNMTTAQLGSVIRPHPTFNEVISDLFENP